MRPLTGGAAAIFATVAACVVALASATAVAFAVPASGGSPSDAELAARYERETSRDLPPLPASPAAPSLPVSRGVSVESDDALPSSYSSVDEGIVTPVRDQTPFGTCWAYGTLSVLETSLARKGEDVSSLDLSERHLAYFTYHVPQDPLHNTDGDSVTMPDTGTGTAWDEIPSYLDSGGNTDLTAHVLAGGLGPVGEDVASTADLASAWYECNSAGGDWRQFLADTALSDEVAFDASARLTGYRDIPMSDVDGVKRAVRDWGSAGGAMCYEYDYLNWDKAAYYHDGTGNPVANHMITIVGWDDSFPVSSFGNTESWFSDGASHSGPGARPSHPGAWLCKNSWGSGWSGGGLFWISYEDAVLSTGSATAFDAEPLAPGAAESRHAWVHDGGQGMHALKVEDKGAVANVFEVPEGLGTQVLDSAGVFVASTGAEWSLQVRRNPTSATSPSTGEALLAEPVTGTTTYAGWYEIPLPEPVELEPGDTFVVELTLSTPGSQGTWVQADGDHEYDWFSTTGACEPGESFVRTSRSSWVDLSRSDLLCCARLRAFTHDAPEAPLPSLDDAVVAGIPDQTYTGRPQRPEVHVTLGGSVLAEGVDYSLSWEDDVDAGTATVTATGANGREGSVSATFVILPAPISQASAEVSPVVWEGSGSSLSPSVTVTFNGRVLVLGTDYSVSFAGEGPGDEAGTATLTGVGNFSGTCDVPFEILPPLPLPSLADATIADIPDQTYTGGIRHPEVDVSYDGESLSEGVDYSLSWADDVDAGTATVTATGMGGYEGSKSATFRILPASLSDASIEVGRAVWDGPGTELSPSVTATFNGRGLLEGVDYSVSFAGEGPGDAAGTATLTGIGNFSGTREVPFAIVSRPDLSGAVFQAIPSQTYTGSEICLAVTLFHDGNQLEEGVDYELSWNNNVNKGIATVTATGKGDYRGTKSTIFEILPAPMSGVTVSVAPGLWRGSSELLSPEVTATFNGKVLSAGTDYDVSFAGDGVGADAGTATLVGKGNFTGTRQEAFDIVYPPTSLAEAEFLPIPDQAYTGYAIEPATCVSFYGKILAEGTDYELSWDSNVVAGTATVTATGIGSNAGTGAATAQFAILPAPISSASIEVGSAVWGGSPSSLSPEVTASFNGKSLVAGTDYDASFSGDGPGTEAGTATLTGKGNFTGTQQASFDIVLPPPSLADASIATIPDQMYTGSEICPVVTVTYDGEDLVCGTDYSLAWDSNVDAGTATVTATGQGAYTGEVSATFGIAPAPMSSASATVGSVIWRGAGTTLSPDIEVTFNGNALAEGTDYEVGFSGEGPGEDAGTATITGQGNFTGTLQVSFKILPTPPNLADATISEISSQTYTGAAIRPTVTVTYGGEALVLGTDYSLEWEANVNAGTATVTATGTGAYEGSISATFGILPVPVSQVAVQVTPVEWPGSAELLAPETAVTFNGASLSEGTDYDISFAGEGPGAGAGTATITGRGNFAGTDDVAFDILMPPTNLAAATIAAISDQTYTGFAIEPDVLVTFYGQVLEKDTDYSLTWDDNVDAGMATVTATGIGGAAGEASATFEILPAPMSSATVSVSEAIWHGDASLLSPDVTATLNGLPLAEGTDYEVSFAGEGTGEGTGTATLTGRGNLEGTLQVAFDIVEPPPVPTLADAAIDPIPAQTYTGSAIRPAVRVTYGGEELTLGSDYLLSWSGNVDAGIATVTATGMGGYEGSASAEFTIVPASLSGARLTVSSVVWAGRAATPVPRVSLTGFSLVRDRDYRLTWSGNSAPGTGTVTATGTGNFSGSASAEFRIWAFADSETSPHRDDVDWLGGTGISTGWPQSNGTSLFKPREKVARCDMAAFLFRLACRWGVASEGWSAGAAQRRAFSDVSASTPHCEEIWWMASAGISTGWQVGGRREFRPYDKVARQDMAAFLFRLAKVARRGGAGTTWHASAAARTRFRDVDPARSDNHHEETWWLADVGVSEGWDLGGGRYEFRGREKVARCDMAAFLHRMDGLPAGS